jgi:hypothetical protein
LVVSRRTSRSFGGTTPEIPIFLRLETLKVTPAMAAGVTDRLWEGC